MIFYFSGTGNSYHVAKEIAMVTKEEMVNISQAIQQEKYEYSMQPKERIGFIFPVYYWGLPTVVEEFIKKLRIKNISKNYIYSIVTCGASIGTTISRLDKLLGKNKLKLHSGYSIAFPDNYVLLYDVPDEEEQDQILKEAEVCLEAIKKDVVHRRAGIFNIRRGAAPLLLSGILHLYYKKNRKTKAFYATEECIGCGLCERICPVATISLTTGVPQWGKECTQCLGCIHRCPVHAIQYGKKTKKRRRYVHPDLLDPK